VTKALQTFRNGIRKATKQIPWRKTLRVVLVASVLVGGSYAAVRNVRHAAQPPPIITKLNYTGYPYWAHGDNAYTILNLPQPLDPAWVPPRFIVTKAHRKVAAHFHPDRARLNFNRNMTQANFVVNIHTEAENRFLDYWSSPYCKIEETGVDGGLLERVVSTKAMEEHGLPHYSDSDDCVCTLKKALAKTAIDALTPPMLQKAGPSTLEDLAKECPPCTAPKLLGDLWLNLHRSRIPPMGLGRYWNRHDERGLKAWVKSFGNPGQYPAPPLWLEEWIPWLSEKYHKAMRGLDPPNWTDAMRAKALEAGWAVRSDFFISPMCPPNSTDSAYYYT
jgi:hypothetical protein